MHAIFEGMNARRLLATAALTSTALGALAVPAKGQQPDPSDFDYLREPRITTRPAERVLVVRAVGDPNVVGPQAFGLLFQLYYTSPLTPKAPPGPTVKARWPSPEGTPREEWVGLYALPVPEAMAEPPPHQAPPGIEATVTEWEYGEIAEVLHVGPYSREQPTLDRLRAFAMDAGYEVLEGHEEEYILGPTMAGPGDPERYLTILRYRVRKSSGASGVAHASAFLR